MSIAFRLLAAALLMLWQVPALAADAPRPFASNLFGGSFAKAPAQALCAPGDRIVLRIWGGAVSIDDTLAVGPDGALDVPGIGSVPVAGLEHAKIADALKSKLLAGGDAASQIYVAPLDSRPVAVLVTGSVAKPGSYQGSPLDSVLAYLDKAGGISPKGSFRDISLMRQGQKIASFDLYPFARKGVIEGVRFADGDTVVVGTRGPAVTAVGCVRNEAVFEFPKGGATGRALAELAEPEGRATHVTLTGTRNGAPYSAYLPVAQLASLDLRDGDRVQFSADVAGGTIMVQVEGAVKGTARFPVRAGAHLSDVVNFIAVDPARAELKSMYIKRRSVAARQKRAIAESLRRLEETVMTATSQSAEEAGIRAKEAESIAKFVERAKAVEPEGIVVLDRDSDLALEDGDVIVVPEKSDVVLVTGEVVMPQAMVWSAKKDLEDYIRGAGGFNSRSDPDTVIVVHRNGAVTPDTREIRAGDQIMVLPRVESKSLQSLKDISQVMMQVAVSARCILPSVF